MADLRISELATLAGANLAAGDFLPIADTSASETKKITVTDLVGNATTLIADGTIPGAKILFGSGTIPASALAGTSITANQLANDAVTAAKLADESSVDLVTTLPGTGAFVGQIALDTDDNKIYCWNGSTWISVKGAGSVNAVFGSTSGVINIVATTVGDEVTISATLDNTANAAEFLAGPTASAGTVGYRPIVGADLPTATTTTKGAVIVNGNGLSLSGDTIIVNNSVTAEASNFHIVQYTSKGLITAGRVIDAGDLPIATSSSNGILKPGTGLNVTGSGTLNHNNSVGSGSGVKVSFDNEGHVTGVAVLSESDIPNLSAAKLTTGTLDIARVGTNTVIGSKLANFSVSKIGADTPTPDHIGQFFFNPISRDLFLWDGNVYQPVGISAGEIVFAGTYDAATNLLTSVTAQGLAAGFTNNAVLPAASALNNRYYVVVSNTGTGTSPAPVTSLQPPDLLLSNGTSYVLVDVSQTVTAQTASTVVFTPTGGISSNNVQGAIAEVDTEKLAKAGDTLTGQLLVSNTGSLVFEGATDNTFETTLAVTDPTADRTITLPDISGTVITTGDTGSVTSTMILDGAILNVDVNANAAIAGTKISPDFGSQAITTTGAFTHALGTSSVPTITFTGDLNTGIYSPGADQVAISTGGVGRVFVSASGNLGIGTTSPAFAAGEGLEIERDSVSATLRLQRINTGGSILEIRADDGKAVIDSRQASTDLAFQTNSAERLRITSGGLVGIGTTSPSSTLTVGGNPPAGGAIAAVGAAAGVALALSDNTNSSLYVRTAAGGAIIGTDAGGTIRFATSGNDTANEKARIDNSGRLLVGTSSARSNFYNASSSATSQVEGTDNNGSAVSIVQNFNGVAGNGAQLFLGRSDGSTIGSNTLVPADRSIGRVSYQANDGTEFVEAARIEALVDGTPGTNDMPGRLVFSTTADGASSPTERMRITQAGYLKASNTGTYTGAAANYHELRGNAGSGSLVLQIANTSSTGNGVQIDSNSDGLAYAYLIGFSTSASANRIIIWSNGNVVNTNNSYGAISDIKLKENIVDANSQWDDLKALQVRNYNFKEGQTHTQIGLVAQEVELVSPGLVTESPDRDEDGNDLGTVTKSVNYSVLYMKAVKALQEAMERIETLEASNADLLARVSALEAI